ncbi:MAG: pyridoxine 5'-phosphate synthase, partial [Dehalococcoidia bacterium]
RVEAAVKELKDAGIVCSAFIEPDPQQIKRSAEVGFDAVELWTGGYANARSAAQRSTALETLRCGVEIGLDCGLEVHGGHGLTYQNVTPAAAIPGFSEFNIGHSIIARAIFVGLRKAVREMRRLLEAPEGDAGTAPQRPPRAKE